MRRNLLAVIAVMVVFTGVAVGHASDTPVAKPQTTCPVSGEPIDKSVHIDYQGQRIYFCCNKCPVAFLNDPEKYFARIEKAGIQLENIQTTCPVSGEKLDEGDMGKPVSISYKGRTIQLCCKMCIKKFEADPAKYLANLPGQQPAAR